jgi:hypothetical protein
MAQPRSPREVFLALASATARSSAPATTTTISPRPGSGAGSANSSQPSARRLTPRPRQRRQPDHQAYGLEVITPCHGPQVSRVIVPARHLLERFLPMTTPAQTTTPAQRLRLAEHSSVRSPAGERG